MRHAAEARILVGEDDRSLRESMAEFLGAQGFAVEAAEGGEQADSRLARGGVDLVVLDVMLPGEDGLSIYAPPVQALWHAGLAPTFAFTWYALVATALGVFRGVQGGGWEPEGFSGPALTWQVFQGLVLYAAVAAACYAVRGGREAAAVLEMPGPACGSRGAPLRRYLIRDGEAMTPVDVGAIVTITGAQDYAEVSVASGGRHLIRLSLAELEARLDPAAFVRVHRSAIIHLAQLTRTEPAGGGRLLAHMRDGQIVNVSRAGAQALRRFLI